MRVVCFYMVLALVCFACSSEKSGTTSSAIFKGMPEEFDKIPELKDFKITFNCGELIKVPQFAMQVTDTSLIRLYFGGNGGIDQLSSRSFKILAKSVKGNELGFLVWAEVLRDLGGTVTSIKMGVYNSDGKLLGSVDVCSDLGSLAKSGCVDGSRIEVFAGEKELTGNLLYRQFVTINGEEMLLVENRFGLIENSDEILGLTGTYLDREVQQKILSAKGGIVISPEGIGDFVIGQKFDAKGLRGKYDFQFSEVTSEYIISLPNTKQACFMVNTVNDVIKQIKVEGIKAKTISGIGIDDVVVDLLKKLDFTDLIYMPENKEIYIQFAEYPNMWFITKMKKENEIDTETNSVDPGSIMPDQLINAVIVYDEN